MKALESYSINQESMVIDPTEKMITMFFCKPNEKYGFTITYLKSILGMGIGLNYEWPEAPDDRHTLKSAMITGYQFKQFSYGTTVNEDPHEIYFIVFKNRDHFYINYVIFDEKGAVDKTDLCEFSSKEEMLEAAYNELWIDFENEVKRFLHE